MDVIHFQAQKHSPLFKSLSPSLSGHTPLPLIMKCRNTAPCFIACTTPEMINNPCLVTIHHVSAREEDETVMKCPISTHTTTDQHSNRSHWVKPPFSHQLGSRCICSDLGVPLLHSFHGNADAMGSSWS
ncbi:Hypothetical predicted protein [Xyrichtys novacula]|uniref:Uncharacterized protein n=1 Tax=Xyrichtys novacula TaxID=13765 RepID=A0AAV1ERW8_XYRNO|nr:Hypothetical predicted protein [Xyrichtys novacula]